MRGEDVVAAARAWIGTPYHHQASLRGVGCDCLGLVRGVWRDCIGPEPAVPPAYGRDWASVGGREILADAAARYLVALDRGPDLPGDVILFRWRDGLPAAHCAIATGAGTMVHAHEGAAVAEVALSAWWTRHRAASFRFPGIAR